MLFKTKIGAAIAIAVAMALVVVLVTPDPTDDVEGILHLCKQLQGRVQLLDSAFGPPLIARAKKRSHVERVLNAIPNLLDLNCTCRC